MANTVANEVFPLDGVLDSKHEDMQGFGVKITDRRGLACVQLFATKGNEKAVAKALKISENPGEAVVAGDLTALPLAPGQWLVMSEEGRDGSLADDLRKKLKAKAYVSEQSHSRVVLRIQGDKARDLMSRACRLDLHESVTQTGFCAQTNMAQVGVVIHQVSDEPTYDIILYAGFAQSFMHFLKDTAAQFGYEIAVEG